MDVIQRLFIEAHRDYRPDSLNEYFFQESFNIQPEVIGNRFMSRRVYGYIQNRLHCKIERQYIFDNTRVSICIYCLNKNYPFAELYRVLNFYIIALNRMGHLPVLNITLYLTNLKKQFPKTSDLILNEDNVNSGVSIFNNEDRMIVIYRKEELFKVLLHELIHYYGIDFHNYGAVHDRYFIEKYGIQVSAPLKNKRNPLALFESYTESIACYGYILTRMLLKGEPIEQSNITAHVVKETKHYMMQASKVLKYSHLKENTHLFSYYIVKAAIYAKFNEFIKLINSQGIRLDTLGKQDNYLTFIKLVVDDETFWKTLKKTKTRTILLSSLKMTQLTW